MWELCRCRQTVGVEFGCDVVKDVADWDVKHLYDPKVPLIEKIPSGLYNKRTIVVKAKSTSNPLEFSINIKEGDEQHSDVTFHFNPRFDRKVVVRNHKRRGSWGEEEIATEQCFPFTPNRWFQIQFFVADSRILVAVNGRHFCAFKLRLPIETAKFLQVRGDIELSAVHIQNADMYPVHPPTARSPIIILPRLLSSFLKPKFKRKRNMIAPGTTVTIHGQVKLLPQQFYVNLQIGSSLVPHPVIPLHINLRLCRPGLLEEQMIFNSWVNGSWGEEMKPDNCPFSPGMKFSMKIRYYEEGFHISVNDHFLIAFPMRFSTPPVMDTVLVQGDVIIRVVHVKGSALKSLAD